MAFTSNNDSKMTKTNMEYDNCTPTFQKNIMETFKVLIMDAKPPSRCFSQLIWMSKKNDILILLALS